MTRRKKDPTSKELEGTANRMANERLAQVGLGNGARARAVTRDRSPGQSADRESTLTRPALTATFLIDPQGVILSIDRAFETMLGFEPGDLIGKRLDVFLRGPLFDGAETGVAEVIRADHDRAEREYQARRADGTELPVELVVHEAEPGSRFVGVLRDLSRFAQSRRELIDVSVREQVRLARLLHDGFSQEITALALYAHTWLESIDPLTDTDLQLPTRVCAGLDRLARHVRFLLQVLRGQEVLPHYLPTVLADLAIGLTEVAAIPCTFEQVDRFEPRNATQATDLYDLVREACLTAITERKTKQLRIRVVTKDDHVVVRLIDDNHEVPPPTGRGSDWERLFNRAELVGARLLVTTIGEQECELNISFTQNHPHEYE